MLAKIDGSSITDELTRRRYKESDDLLRVTDRRRQLRCSLISGRVRPVDEPRD